MKKRKGKNCALFILTAQRPKRQSTLKSLKRYGYTGKVYLVCGDDDPTLDEYKELYGDMVKVFSKKDYLGKFDLMSNIVKYNAVVYARNAVYDIARELGVDYMCVMDDDYSTFYVNIDHTCTYNKSKMTDINGVIKAHFRYLATSGLDVLAFAQGGDFAGGWSGRIAQQNFPPLRKAMNVFFFDVNNPVEFNGVINEDSTMGVQIAQRGGKVLTNTLVQIDQKRTQQGDGGLTDIYREDGTYQKSFYTLLASPSSVKVAYVKSMGRVHHSIDGNSSYPKIISARHKK